MNKKGNKPPPPPDIFWTIYCGLGQHFKKQIWFTSNAWLWHFLLTFLGLFSLATKCNLEKSRSDLHGTGTSVTQIRKIQFPCFYSQMHTRHLRCLQTYNTFFQKGPLWMTPPPETFFRNQRFCPKCLGYFDESISVFTKTLWKIWISFQKWHSRTCNSSIVDTCLLKTNQLPTVSVLLPILPLYSSLTPPHLLLQ